MTLPLLLRGISGSGKSTLSRALCARAEAAGLSCVVHSTDDLFMAGGEYRFDPDLLGAHHERTLSAFRASLEQGIDLVILDNTNLSASSLKSGWDIGLALGLSCALVELEPLSLEAHALRTLHGLSQDALEHQLKTYQEHREEVNVLDFVRTWRIPALTGEDGLDPLTEEILAMVAKGRP